MICPNCKQENDDNWPLEINGKIAYGGCQDCGEEQWDAYRDYLERNIGE